MTESPRFAADHPAVVALVVAEGAAPDALNAAAAMLDDFGVAWIRVQPPEYNTFLTESLAAGRAVIVAAPDGRCPGELATLSRLPVIRVPSGDGSLQNLDLLWNADGNLPGPTGEEPFATMAIGEAGAKNAALFVVAMLALTDDRLRDAWTAFRTRQTEAVLAQPPLTRST